MEDTGSWATLEKDDNMLIVGLKELAQDTFPIVNKHTYFAHVFKGQEGWQVRAAGVTLSHSTV
jgi:saccharopine dehydrogenase (NAD+, L-lysine-forming)